MRVTFRRTVAWVLILGLASTAEGGILRKAGRSLGQGAVDALQPALATTVDHVKSAGHELIADANDRIATTLTGAEAAGGRLLTRAGDVADASLHTVNGILAARIVQIKGVSNELLRKAIGGVDEVARKRIEQLIDGVGGIVEQANEVIQKALDRVDATLRNNLRPLLESSIQRADDILAARIGQIDEVVGRRIGNLDAIATKQRLSFEAGAIRVAVIIGLIIFIVFVCKRLWAAYGSVSDKNPPSGWAGVLIRAKALAVPFIQDVLSALFVVGVLYALYEHLPFDANAEAKTVRERHEDGLREALVSLDVPHARFHASQLEVLMPEASARFSALATKTELVRDLVARPALLSTRTGIAGVIGRIEDLERLVVGTPDPDLLVANALVLWEAGETHGNELQAARLCAQALRLQPEGFALSPLARGYIEAFLHSPWDGSNKRVADTAVHEDLRSALQIWPGAEAAEQASPLERTLALARLMRDLDREAGNAYIAMVAAHVAYIRTHPAGSRDDDPSALADRTKAAQDVVSAWSKFDHDLADRPDLEMGTGILAVFRLNDALLARARWFIAHPEERRLPPLLMSEPARQAHAPRRGAAPPSVLILSDRLTMAPPRIAWADRYADLFPGDRADIIAYQEAERFRAFERAAAAYEEAALNAADGDEAGRRLVAYRAAVLGLWNRPQGGPATPVGLSPADAEFWRGESRVPLLGPTEPTIVPAHELDRRRLRLL